eukprot:TRINITY_DN8909_c0_g2_i2.p1 TRINITY_DN8909_c0_g2~~TRINITY_DN8909_c0_g2_i2.p1  ORF type:complete len:656 (+),score=169.57 TRINITY_DN8909_c0_g2_i2:152-1969(+)
MEGILKEFLSSFEKAETNFLESCCEYLFEKEDYIKSPSKQNDEKRVSEWNNFLNNIDVKSFMEKIDSERVKKFDLVDAQFWDINYDKKTILLFMCKHFLFDNLKALDLRDMGTGKSIFGSNPIIKALIFELPLFCYLKNSTSERDFIKVLLNIYTKNISMDLELKTTLSYLKQMNYILYLIFFHNDVVSKQWIKEFQLKLYDVTDNEVDFQFDNMYFPNYNTNHIKGSTNQKKNFFLILGLCHNYYTTLVDFSNSNIGNIGATCISEMLKHNNTITSLNLSSNQFDDVGFNDLAQSLQNHTALLSVNLSGNKIGEGAQSIAETLLINSTLSFINISDVDLRGKGVEYIAKSLLVNTTLTSINLGANQLGPDGAQAISATLQKNHTITLINLQNNMFGIEGIQYITDALMNNGTITEVDLSANRIGDEGASILSHLIESNTTITTLSLNCNQIGEEGANSISSALAKNSTLQILHLEYNKLSKRGIKAISLSLIQNDTLQSINLESNLIGKKGAKWISCCLKQNSTLTHINLRNNKLEGGVDFITEALKYNTTLTSINLEYNAFFGGQTLEDCLQLNSTIIQLHLQGNLIPDSKKNAIHQLLEKRS